MLTQHTTDSQAIATWINYFTISRNKAPRTAKEYARDINRFSRYIAPHPLTEATTAQIEDWRDFLLTEGRNQPQSVNRKIAALMAFFTWYKKKKKGRPDNPCEDVEKPATAKTLPKVMSEAEVECFLSIRLKHRRHADFLDARDRAMMEVLYGSGLRRFEVCALDLEDIDLTTRKLVVRMGKGRKTRHGYLSEPAADAIRSYLEIRKRYAAEFEPALFLTINGDRISPRQLWAVFANIRQAAKAQGLVKHCVPHSLRHSYASHLYRNSRNIRAVQKLLGHSSINTTERYVHVDDDELRDIYEASHPRAKAA